MRDDKFGLRVCTLLLFSLSLPACADRQPPPADSAAVAPPAGSPVVATSEPLRALGTEPFWALDIDSTGLRFTTPEDTAGMRFPPNAPSPIAGDTLVWMAETEMAAIHVRLWPTQCSDGMSDRVYPWSALVRVAGTEYRGCANRRSAIVP